MDVGSLRSVLAQDLLPLNASASSASLVVGLILGIRYSFILHHLFFLFVYSLLDVSYSFLELFASSFFFSSLSGLLTVIP